MENSIIFDSMKKIKSDEIKIRCDTFAVTAGKNGYVGERNSRSFYCSLIFRCGSALSALLLFVNILVPNLIDLVQNKQ